LNQITYYFMSNTFLLNSAELRPGGESNKAPYVGGLLFANGFIYLALSDFLAVDTSTYSNCILKYADTLNLLEDPETV
jgi:hypothetical protein